MLFWFVPTGIFGVETNNATINPKPKKKQKNNIVFSHPCSTSEYLVINGDIKYPKDPADVTMPVAIVLLDTGKCFATTETGILIAVDPSPTPTNIPIVIVK